MNYEHISVHLIYFRRKIHSCIKLKLIFSFSLKRSHAFSQMKSKRCSQYMQSNQRDFCQRIHLLQVCSCWKTNEMSESHENYLRQKAKFSAGFFRLPNLWIYWILHFFLLNMFLCTVCCLWKKIRSLHKLSIGITFFYFRPSPCKLQSCCANIFEIQ